ncbi:hypothetical protein EGW08_002655, partial [Elysia chlorotica]
MPKAKEVTNHPCHLLSLPSAKRFWCRHCMSVFEDAITRWRHSRSCRYGVVNNFMKRRELEAKALQNTTVLNPVEARVEQSIQMADLATGARTVHVKDENGIEILTTPEDFTCFICHKKFQSMDEMRHHVKYPCNASKIVTSRVPHPKNSVPVFIESMPARHSWDQTQGLEIHQPVTSYMQEPGQSQQQHVLEQHLQAGGSVEVHMQDSGGEHCYNNQAVSYDADVGTSALPSDQEEHKNLTPTTIYVNEKGETVIEVENLDLGSDGGELSLAHLLTQLSQQGIVFDKSRSGPLQAQDFVLESSREQQQPATTHMYEVETQDHANAGMQPDDPQVGSETLAENESLVETPIKEEDEEEGQPTAEDAANTLAQLAGFRGFIQKQHQETGGSGTAFHQGQGQTQTVEMLQLAESESESAGAVAQTVQTYRYGNPVTIQYTYPTSQSVAVVGDQTSQQEVAQSQHHHHHHHHIVGAQHMTLQEVLTAGSATQLYIEAESESEGSVKPGTVSGLESVRYIVDPVTGHQVVQHIDEGSRDDSSQDGCLTRDLESSAEPAGDEVVYVSAQADGTTLDHVSGETCTEDVPRHAAIVASESDTPHADMDFNSAAGEFTSIAVSTSGEEDLVPMEVDHEQPSEQDEIVDNARTENTFPVEQAVTYQDQTENDNVDVSLHTQAAVTSLDDQAAETASEQVTHCVSSISNTEGQTTGETDHAVVQLVNTDDGSDPHIAGNSSNLCITDYEDNTPQDN